MNSFLGNQKKMAFGTYEKKLKQSSFMQNWVDQHRFATRPQYMRNLTFEQWKNPSDPAHQAARKEQMRMAIENAKSQSNFPSGPFKLDMTQLNRILKL